MSICDAVIDGCSVRVEFEGLSDAESKTLVAEVEGAILGLRRHLPQGTKNLTLATLAALTLCARLEKIQKAASMEDVPGPGPESYTRLFFGAGQEAVEAPELWTDITINKRRMRIQMPGLQIGEIARLASYVDECMNEVIRGNTGVGDSRKLAILSCLHFAFKIKNSLEELEGAAPSGSPPVYRSTVEGRIIELRTPQRADKTFRGVLRSGDDATVRLRIPTPIINSACRAFVSGKRVSVTGRLRSRGKQGYFNVAEIA